MQCQTASRPAAPGRAVPVLLGAPKPVRCCWRRMAGLAYFDRRLPVAGREDSPDGSGFMLVNMAMNAASVYVPLRGKSATQDRRAACAGVLLQLVAKSDYVLY